MTSGNGVMTVWVRYTTPMLGRLVEEIAALEHPSTGSYPDVVDDDVADFVFEVGSADEGEELVRALRRRLEETEGLEIVRASFFSRAPVS